MAFPPVTKPDPLHMLREVERDLNDMANGYDLPDVRGLPQRDAAELLRTRVVSAISALKAERAEHDGIKSLLEDAETNYSMYKLEYEALQARVAEVAKEMKIATPGQSFVWLESVRIWADRLEGTN